MSLPARPLGRTGLTVSAIGFGSFKIGRNQGIKYPQGYDLPDDTECGRLLDQILAMGITLIDTAPAYGIAEQRIGQHLASRRDEFVLSSKVGERYDAGVSEYLFDPESVKQSVEESLSRLRTDHLDLLFIHSDGNDLEIQQNSGTVEALQKLRDQGKTRAIGLSGKTVAGAREALQWADCLMIEYHLEDRSHEDVIREGHEAGVGILVKKGLAAGHLTPAEAISFVLENPAVDSLVLGGLNPTHFEQNCRIASNVRNA